MIDAKKVFTALITFGTWGDEAIDAEKELRAAGYGTKILDDIDDYSPATFMDAWRPCEVAWKQLNALVDPFGGHADDAALVDHYEPRDLAFPRAFEKRGYLQ
jgi:hypothetical protein